MLVTNMGITVITSSQRLKTSFINLQRLALIPFHSLELKNIVVQGKWELCVIHQFGR
ncbi:hypothetical protein HU200_050709 [Digitaria exilis]|uniref:Uncharacterized protein n=1 Tax=Digitaria exilis TaxID=1010633 RepID=A0A835EA52_9POAL|nr:hypothetical protein HU200_050709 [Digitaria exilis]